MKSKENYVLGKIKIKNKKMKIQVQGTIESYRIAVRIIQSVEE